MKINIKLKDFLDKETLQKSLDTKLKKPVQHLIGNPGEALPFCYEAEYFDDGGGFLSIGVAKELQAHFKKQRVKGQGKDENGNLVKIDKKKVAIGQVALNEDGVYEFMVEAGLMKKPQVKATIKSIGYLKKNIGDNFAILKGVPQEEEEDSRSEEATDAPDDATTDRAKKRALRRAKRNKVKENVGKLQDAAGVAEESKIRENLEKFKQALAQLTEEAQADGEIDRDEQAEIDALSKNIDRLEKQLEHLGGRKAQLNPKRRAKVKENIDTISGQLQVMLQRIGL